MDTYTVKLVFEEPFAGLWNVLSYAYSGFNSPAAVEKWGDEYGRHPSAPVPSCSMSGFPGSRLTFVRNPDYVQVREDATNPGPALLAQIVFLVIPEDGTAMAALQTGELDASILNADTLPQVEGNPDFNIYIITNSTRSNSLSSTAKSHPSMTPSSAPRWATPWTVRCHRPGLARWLLDPMYNPLAPGLIGYDASIGEEYGTPYDPDTARQMLEELGWVDSDGDGIRDKDGEPACFEMWSYSGYTYVIAHPGDPAAELPRCGHRDHHRAERLGRLLPPPEARGAGHGSDALDLG